MTNPAPQQPQYQPAAPADYPGKTLGLVGLILSLVAQSQSKKAGFPNQLAKVGIIIGAILTALGIIGSIFYGIALGSAVSQINSY